MTETYQIIFVGYGMHPENQKIIKLSKGYKNILSYVFVEPKADASQFKERVSLLKNLSGYTQKPIVKIFAKKIKDLSENEWKYINNFEFQNKTNNNGTD